MQRLGFPDALEPRWCAPSVCVACLCAVLLGGCASAPRYAGRPAADPATASSIYVVKRGWHIDIGFAAADLSAPLSSVASEFPGVRYVLFGFGDRRYLTAKHEDLDALLAALWGGPALMLTTALSAPPREAFGADEVVKLPLSAAQERAAQRFVWQALSSRHGQPVVVGYGPYPGSLYLGSGERYFAFHTCNTWAAQALRAAGLPVRSAGVIFAAQLWRQVRTLARRGRIGADRSSVPPQPASAPRATAADQTPAR